MVSARGLYSGAAQNHRPAAAAPHWRPLPAFLVVTRRPCRPLAGNSYFFLPAFLVDFFFVFFAAIRMAPCGTRPLGCGKSSGRLARNAAITSMWLADASRPAHTCERASVRSRALARID